MAGFKTHITFSTCIGCGYAAYGVLGQDLPVDTAIVGGALCGFSGMLPDIDSDFGVPLRETMAFTAAIVPMLLIGHLTALDLSHDGMVLVAVGMYLLIRFGLTRFIRRWTVHRGMFHSIPAGLIFAGIAFLLAGTSPLHVRYFKAGGVFLGFMSHLLLDEIYSVEWKGGRWTFKRSFGTAIKFWSKDAWANFSTYWKLAVVAVLILGEPSVMESLQDRNPKFAERYQRLQQRFQSVSALPSVVSDGFGTPQSASNTTVNNSRSAPPQLPPSGASAFDQPPVDLPVSPSVPPWYLPRNAPEAGQQEMETAGRPWSPSMRYPQ